MESIVKHSWFACVGYNNTFFHHGNGVRWIEWSSRPFNPPQAELLLIRLAWQIGRTQKAYQWVIPLINRCLFSVLQNFAASRRDEDIFRSLLDDIYFALNSFHWVMGSKSHTSYALLMPEKLARCTCTQLSMGLPLPRLDQLYLPLVLRIFFRRRL